MFNDNIVGNDGLLGFVSSSSELLSEDDDEEEDEEDEEFELEEEDDEDEPELELKYNLYYHNSNFDNQKPRV